MSEKFSRIKGFADFFEPESLAYTHIEANGRKIFSRYGFQELRTPILVYTALFQRGIGTETDVVQKEMFSFIAKVSYIIYLFCLKSLINLVFLVEL